MSASQQGRTGTPADRYLAFAFGVIFLGVLAYAGLNEGPLLDPGRFFILRVLLGISAAGVASTIPGFLNLSIGNSATFALRAGGAIAVFAIIYLVDPPAVVQPSGIVSAPPANPGPLWPETVERQGGCFQMGSPEGEEIRDKDEVQHEVCVNGLVAGKYEVTFTQYDHFATATGRAKPSDEGWGRGQRPVINVSQRDATDYARWLASQTGRPFRLPTEAEWEFLARGGSQTPYWWGSLPDHDMANFEGKIGRDRFDFTSPVGSFDANPFGLHDTAGNAWELTCSAYVRQPDGSETRCAGNEFNDDIVIRGGAFASGAKWIRSAARGRNRPMVRSRKFGFRVVAPIGNAGHNDGSTASSSALPDVKGGQADKQREVVELELAPDGAHAPQVK